MIIYKITFPEGRAYIGQTIRSIEHRLSQHFAPSRRNETPIAKACRKYARATCKIEVLCECSSKRELDACESALIASHGTYISSGGYNVTYGGGGNNGWVPTEATRALWRSQRAGRLTPEWHAKMANGRKGKKRAPRSAAHRAALSVALKGRVISPEWRANLAEAGRGKRHTATTRLKMSDSLSRSDYHTNPLRAEERRRNSMLGVAARSIGGI